MEQESEIHGSLAGQIRYAAPLVQPRPRKKSLSRGRHSHSSREGPKDETVRAVTPESTMPSAVRTPGADAVYHPSSPPAKSPRTRLPRRQRDHSASVSNTDDESAIDNKRQLNKAKSKSKSKDDAGAGSDASPNSFISKARTRLGSISASTPFTSKPDDPSSSIGFPSVVQSPPLPDLGDYRQHIKSLQRGSGTNFSVAGSQGTLRSPLLMSTDSNKILHLMKTTCGRMHGILFFRPTNTEPWASGYCAINVAPGSLVCQTKGDVTAFETLIPDLRGCNVRTHYDSETQSVYLGVITSSSGQGFQLRPPVPETFDSWLAALLCWQPLRPKGLHNKMTVPQSISIMDKKVSTQKHTSDVTSHKSAAVIKVGKMLLWEGALPPPRPRADATSGLHRRVARGEHWTWIRVSCTLHENGHFKLLTESDAKVLLHIQLGHLSRCAVQHFDPSILENRFCIALFPYYAAQSKSKGPTRPIYLALESRVPFEAWYVLLRAFTVPELYGPERPLSNSERVSRSGRESKQASLDGLFRVERSVWVKITEARLTQNQEIEAVGDNRVVHSNTHHETRIQEDLYAEIILENDVRARTSTKSSSNSIFWAEEFEFNSVPPMISKVCVLVKIGNPAEKEWTIVAHGPYEMSHNNDQITNTGHIKVSSHDTVVGRVEMKLDELDEPREVEKRWPILDQNNNSVGDLLMKLKVQETVVLMQEQYNPLSQLLQTFTNGLTPQLAIHLGSELKDLADLLLDIYQVSGNASEWIGALAEEEIDGIYKETPAPRMRFTGRGFSSASLESGEHRELLVRDLSRSANSEANLLFRGNSLVTKAFDTHMRRLGREYLEETLGPGMRDIVRRDPDCEVDPSRVKTPEQLEKNWNSLINLTNSVWKAIADSAHRCPPALRGLFKHIRSCAEDRYGSFIRTVKYTSVSGFLFLRFFCPAILNPDLFGVLTDRPPDRPRRTLTLIAKSLIVLANMAKFGAKERWMEPMNKFMLAATPEFKLFIDQICSISASQIADNVLEPQNTTPLQIFARLPTASREGFPSLPYLLDSGKLYASLVNLWVNHASAKIADVEVESCVRAFDKVCTELRQRSIDCLNTAEQAERPDGDLEPKWQQLLADRQNNVSIDDPFQDSFAAYGNASVSNHSADRQGSSHGYASRPGTATHPATEPEVEGDDTTPSSMSATWDSRRMGMVKPPAGEARALTASSTNSSTVSLENQDDIRPAPMPGSRDGSKKRLFELVARPIRRKTKDGVQNTLEDDRNEF